MALQKKDVPKKAYEDRGTADVDESPLDDPVAEKLRQQRCACRTLHDVHACSVPALHSPLSHGCLQVNASAFSRMSYLHQQLE